MGCFARLLEVVFDFKRFLGDFQLNYSKIPSIIRGLYKNVRHLEGSGLTVGFYGKRDDHFGFLNKINILKTTVSRLISKGMPFVFEKSIHPQYVNF